MNIRRASVRLTVLAGIASAAMLLVPAPAGAATVLSDYVTFRVTRLATGGLGTSACRLTSYPERGQAPEPAQPCNADITGYPSGSAVVMVPNDPTEQIRFNYAVPANGDISGPATETELPPVIYPAYYRGTWRLIAPGVWSVSFRVYEASTAP